MLNAVAQYFASLPPDIRAAIIGSLTTVIAGAFGLLILIWRLRREAQIAIDENKQSEAMKLKLKVYETEVLPTTELLIDAEVALAGYVRRFVSDLNVFGMLGANSPTPAARIPTLIELKAKFDRAAVAIVTFTERWFVIDPRFEIFRIAMNAGLHDVREDHAAYFDMVMRLTPVDLPNGVHWDRPSAEQVQAIVAASDKLLDRLGTITAYASDFQAEMQNVLIGPLFGHTVPQRQPIDPKHVVIRLENDALLMRHFQEDTAWGRLTKQTEQNVRDALHQ